MDARYALIRGGHEQAEYITDAARDDASAYETQLATIKAEAQARIEAARSTLEGERAEKMTAVNARIAEKRAAAATEVEQARQAAQADVENAVRAVAARAGELATGRSPDPDVVNAAVADVMSAGVTR
jgi:F-type H+-transporting ATPase subunit b